MAKNEKRIVAGPGSAMTRSFRTSRPPRWFAAVRPLLCSCDIVWLVDASCTSVILGEHQQSLLENCSSDSRRQFESMLCHIEIEILTACNLKCYNCDRSSRQAPTGEVLTVAQVERFVEESTELDWCWRRIALLGGEPTLHPDLFAILDRLNRYRAKFPEVVFRIISNGYGEQVSLTLERLPRWVSIQNTHKNSVVQSHFDAYNIAPQDLKEYRNADFSVGCTIPFASGMALTRHGYYPCGAGASIDRVFGLGRAVSSLRQVTIEGLTGEFSRLCRYCGHFHGLSASSELMSKSWAEAYSRWREKQPQLALYPSGLVSVSVSGDKVHGPEYAGGRHIANCQTSSSA